MNKQENSIITVEDLKKNPDWTEEIQEYTQWFGTPDYGFRFTMMRLDMFEALGVLLPANGNLVVYVEIINDMLPESIRQEMLNLFYDKILSDHNYRVAGIKGVINNGDGSGPDESFLVSFNSTL